MSSRNPTTTAKTRLSMVELLFREAEDCAARLVGSSGASGWLNYVRQATDELNERLQQNGTRLIYNNGFLHIADDQLTRTRRVGQQGERKGQPTTSTTS